MRYKPGSLELRLRPT